MLTHLNLAHNKISRISGLDSLPLTHLCLVGSPLLLSKVSSSVHIHSQELTHILVQLLSGYTVYVCTYIYFYIYLTCHTVCFVIIIYYIFIIICPLVSPCEIFLTFFLFAVTCQSNV